METPEEDCYFIAGRLRPSDWHQRKSQLLADRTEEIWAKTFEEFFRKRLSLRYLEPIKTLQNEGTFQGEGFSIVTIQCALIEFLAATKIGKNYKYKDPGEHEYSNSSGLFTEFLTAAAPFKGMFDGLDQAKEFYVNVRCALLHEARTKNGWRIWASGQIAIDPVKKIVWRDTLQQSIDAHICAYGKLVLVNKEIQDAFIRKFDYLAIA
jgi:hypothetical protein